MSRKSQIPLRYLVRSWFEAGRRQVFEPASNHSVMEFGLKGSYAEFLYVGKLETEQGPATIRLRIDTLIANIL